MSRKALPAAVPVSIGCSVARNATRLSFSSWTMALYGYTRVSTLDQNLGIQRAALKAAGCDVIRAEKASGTRRDGRTELQVLLDFLRPGDALVITRIDRLARSLTGHRHQRENSE
jgi:DNA invertase Pin-like site-specific DNA recombinase